MIGFVSLLVLLLCPIGALAFTQGPLHRPLESRVAASQRCLLMRRDDVHDRRSVALTWVSLVTVGGAVALMRPGEATAKYTNMEEAREAGERKREEEEKAKGPLVILPGGVRYREELVGKGPGFEKGDVVKIRYEVQKGNGDFMWAKGYGREFLQDVGETYDFVFGAPNSIPKGAEMAMEGMKTGGKRKILVPPSLGWLTEETQPRPETFSGQRKLFNHQKENLIFEVELIRVRKRQGATATAMPTDTNPPPS